MGVDAMLEGLDLVKAGIALKQEQRLEDGTYEGWFKKDDARIDWSKSAAEVYNLIHACNPAPGASTEINGTEVQIYDCARLDGDGEPGELVSVLNEGITMQANGGRILIKRLRPKGGKKQSAPEWIAG